jgi:predicted RecA/RadA family phage recombinase
VRKLVLVEWEDANSPFTGGWVAPAEVNTDTITIHSCGYVLYDDGITIVLASSVAPDDVEGAVSGVITIPYVNVTWIKELKGRKR